MMMRLTAVAIAAFALLASSPAGAGDRWTPFMGTWEYRRVSSRSLTGYDAEGERLELVRAGRSVAGRYFGLERTGEDGIRYTAVAVTKLALGDSGTISFVVPARSLYQRRPATLAAARGMKAVGVTRHDLVMRGRIVDGHLRLACTSDAGACPEGMMVFGKVK